MIQAILSQFSGAVIEKAKNWGLLLLLVLVLVFVVAWRIELAAVRGARTKLAEVQRDLATAQTNVRALNASLTEQNHAVEAWRNQAKSQAERVAQAQARAEAIRQDYEAKVQEALARPIPPDESLLPWLAKEVAGSIPPSGR